MLIPKFAIKNYQFTLVVFLLLLVSGLYSYFTMPRNENPVVYVPGASVTVIYPGASTSDLEELIAIPVEETINELDNIKRINTSMMDGVVVVSVEFNYDADPHEKYDEVVRQVNNIRNDLPEGIVELDLMQWNSTDVAIMQLALVSETTSYSQLDIIAENLKNDIEKSYGIKRVNILALPEQEIHVSMDLEKMAQMNIPVNQVKNAIQSYNANIPGGSINIQKKNFAIKTSGSYESLEDIRNTIVAAYNGQVIYLKDIAGIAFTKEKIEYKAHYDGERAIFLSILQKENINIYDIMDGVKPVIQEHAENLDAHTQLEVVFDVSENIDHRINGFMKNLLQGIIVVGLLILLSIGLSSSLIIITAIPLSVLIGLSFVDLAGFGLQQISIAALVVALGLLVDNSIVMVENISRHITLGSKPRDAAIKGASEIGWPVISATVTTVLAFIPIIMMPDKAGDFIRSLPVTITATLSVSLLIALTLTPLIASVVLKNKTGNKDEKSHSFQLEKYLKAVINGPYRNTLQYVLKRKGLILLITLVVLGISVYIFTHVGISYFPKAETPQFMIRVNMPEGTNLEDTEDATRWVEHVLDTVKTVEHYASNVGKGNPRIYYNIFPKQLAKNFAEIYVELKEYDVDTFYPLLAGLRGKFNEYPGAEINIKEFEQGTPKEAPIVIYIMGDKTESLRTISKKVESWLDQVPGIINIDNKLDKVITNIYFDINKEKANMLGVPVHEIDNTIRTSVSGAKISEYWDDKGQSHDIVLNLSTQGAITLKDFNKIYVESITGKMIPLRQLADYHFEQSQGLITRYNLQKNATINADLKKGVNLDDAMASVISKLEQYSFPPGYDYYLAGEIEERAESFAGMQQAILIALIAIFAVLVLQFNSFIQPLIIYSAIPLAVIGSIWALFITGNTFSFTAFIGLISLVGIVVNNSIILVDYTNLLRKKGHPLEEAIQTAGETRFTPIVLTALTTIGGLLPLTLQGGSLWAPMGWTIIGGLLVSTFLTLLLVPVLYAIVEKRGEVIEKLKQGN